MIRRLIAGQIVPWRRYWATPTARLSAGHDGRGFLDDPEDELGRALNPHVHQLRDLLNRPCLVLSGQPGIGKTMEVDQLAANATEWLQPNERLIKLTGRLLHSPEELRRRTTESAVWTSTVAEGGEVRLLLDGVDEALRRLSALVLDLVDSLKAQPLARVKVILVCRAAEWHHADGQALASLWREDAGSVLYELCPLRWKDVELAARLSNIDPEWFWREVTLHRVQGLAARPITLRLLLDEARAGSEFPGSHHELFSRAIQRLCGELDDERARHLPIPSPPAAQIVRVAARIASLTMLGGRDIIARHTEEIGNGDLPIDEIAGGYETVGDERFALTRELVASTLDTPLFSLRGPERYGFDHQTFAEHLAADYLSGCAPTQLRRLLCVSFEGQERVAPQLAEVAARLATMNSDWCEYLISTEPELLLRADASPLTDEQRERAIGGVLRKAARQEAFDEAGTGFFYHTLRHPQLAAQLRTYIEDPTHNAVVRRMALSIAGDAKVSELEPLLWERIEARDPAFAGVCGALWDITGLHSRDRLIAALHGDLPDNDRGNLRDLAINKLVPTALSVRDVLPFLTPPSAERISFAHGIGKHLTLEDVPSVLAAMETGRFTGHDFIGLNELGARAFEMAMENLDDLKIGLALAHYWRMCARNYRALPYRSSQEPNPLRGLDEPAKRRRLIRLLLELPESEAHDIDRGEMTLVRQDDAEWMLEELPEIAQEHRPVWAQVCARQVWHALPSCRDELIQARHAAFPELRAAFPVAGRFDIATTLRRLRRAQELRMERIRARNSRRWRRYSRAELMVPIWRELETNDTVWVGFCDRARKREDTDPTPDHHADHGDITTSPGWVDADDGQRAGLRAAARRFLIGRHDSARPKQEWNNWTRAACFAIALLREEIDSDYDLRAAIEHNWPRVVFDNPDDQNSAVQRAAVAAVYQLMPDVAADRLALRLCADNCKDGYLLDLERYVGCWDSRLVDVVRQFLFTRGLKPRALRRVFAFLSDHDRESAISLFDEMLALRGGFAPLNARGRALLSIALFVLVPERWDLGWTALNKCNAPISRRVFFEAASEYLDRDFRFHEPLTTAQLTWLCARVWQLFPAVEYNEWHDAHGHVGSRHMMPGLRDGLTGALVTRGTLEACESLQTLADLVPPDQRVWMQWRHNEAVKNALRLAWTARTRTPAEIIAIARDFRVVTIDNVDELLEAVGASLERLQCRLRMAESAELHALWNEPGRTGVATPKDESILSNIVHDWIKRDLGPNGGIVLNREVQATLLSKLDIKVEALSLRRNAEPLTLIIEVKGDWHPQITTALGKQLAKRYLLPNRWTRGIYLVGWFQPEGIQGKKRGWPPPTFTDAEQIVKGWAQEQTPSGLIIHSHLLDCRLAQSSQRVKVNSSRPHKRLSSTKPHSVAA